MKTRIRHIVGCLWVLLLVQCQKNENSLPAANDGVLKFGITHSVDGQKLLFDTLLYKNATGTAYCVSLLHYYISDITLSNNSGEQWKNDLIFYIDASASLTECMLRGVPAGKYTQLSFNIGLSEKQNKDGYLPSTLENLNMAWPTIMGGGYHCLKLEGYYSDSNNNKLGYAVHLGSPVAFVRQEPIPVNITIAKGNTTTLNLTMNLNEWFTRPERYDFILDGNYSMSDTILMKLIRNNGKDVFSIH